MENQLPESTAGIISLARLLRYDHVPVAFAEASYKLVFIGLSPVAKKGSPEIVYRRCIIAFGDHLRYHVVELPKASPEATAVQV